MANDILGNLSNSGPGQHPQVTLQPPAGAPSTLSGADGVTYHSSGGVFVLPYLAVKDGLLSLPQLEAVVLRCLARDPEARPQSAAELIALLAASPRIPDWNVEHRSAWWAAHREAITGARTKEVEPIDSARAVSIVIEDRTP